VRKEGYQRPDISDQEERKDNAESTEFAEFAEKKKESRSLHCAARRARRRRGRENRAAPVGMTETFLQRSGSEEKRDVNTEIVKKRDSSLRGLRSE